MRRVAGIDELRASVGELGVSPWLDVDQNLVDRFADVTQDRQWIHVDAARAELGPYRSTVAHGLLVLSLLPHLATQVYAIDGVSMRVNYGYDRVRFPHVVKVGDRVRDRVELARVESVGSAARAHFVHTIEIDGVERPACIAESITHLVPGTP